MASMKFKNVCVILPAAGEGTRMKIAEKKQFVEIMGKPLISYTIDNFERLTWISLVLVVVSIESEELMQKMMKTYKWKKVKIVALGASSRHRSICNAVSILPEVLGKESEMVVVHDAVRPVVNLEDLSHLVNWAAACGACGLVRKLRSTILEGNPEGEKMVRSLNRENLWESHTPQAFKYSLLLKAYQSSSASELDNGTECLELVRKYNKTNSELQCIKMLEASSLFNKITFKEDLKAFEFYLRDNILNDCV